MPSTTIATKHALLAGGQAGVDHAADGGQDRRRLGVSLRAGAEAVGQPLPLLAVAIAPGIAGSLAIESAVLVWVADHRRPHKYSNKEGEPHSPWRFGTGGKAAAVTA
jgi:hypothetical protein